MTQGFQSEFLSYVQSTSSAPCEKPEPRPRPRSCPVTSATESTELIQTRHRSSLVEQRHQQEDARWNEMMKQTGCQAPSDGETSMKDCSVAAEESSSTQESTATGATGDSVCTNGTKVCGVLHASSVPVELPTPAATGSTWSVEMASDVEEDSKDGRPPFEPQLIHRPKRNVIPKNLEYAAGLSWREENDLKKALYASLQESKFKGKTTPTEERKGPFESRGEQSRPSKPHHDESSQDSTRSAVSSDNSNDKEVSFRARLHAQRKFALGSRPGSPSVSPKKPKPTPKKFFTTKKAKTEDFLTFLCLRGTAALPPHLDFYNMEDADEGNYHYPPTPRHSSNNGSRPGTPGTPRNKMTPSRGVSPARSLASSPDREIEMLNPDLGVKPLAGVVSDGASLESPLVAANCTSTHSTRCTAQHPPFLAGGGSWSQRKSYYPALTPRFNYGQPLCSQRTTSRSPFILACPPNSQRQSSSTRMQGSVSVEGFQPHPAMKQNDRGKKSSTGSIPKRSSCQGTNTCDSVMKKQRHSYNTRNLPRNLAGCVRKSGDKKTVSCIRNARAIKPVGAIRKSGDMTLRSHKVPMSKAQRADALEKWFQKPKQPDGPPARNLRSCCLSDSEQVKSQPITDMSGSPAATTISLLDPPLEELPIKCEEHPMIPNQDTTQAEGQGLSANSQGCDFLLPTNSSYPLSYYDEGEEECSKQKPRVDFELYPNISKYGLGEEWISGLTHDHASYYSSLDEPGKADDLTLETEINDVALLNVKASQIVKSGSETITTCSMKSEHTFLQDTTQSVWQDPMAQCSELESTVHSVRAGTSSDNVWESEVQVSHKALTDEQGTAKFVGYMPLPSAVPEQGNSDHLRTSTLQSYDLLGNTHSQDESLGELGEGKWCLPVEGYTLINSTIEDEVDLYPESPITHDPVQRSSVSRAFLRPGVQEAGLKVIGTISSIPLACHDYCAMPPLDAPQMPTGPEVLDAGGPSQYGAALYPLPPTLVAHGYFQPPESPTTSPVKSPRKKPDSPKSANKRKESPVKHPIAVSLKKFKKSNIKTKKSEPRGPGRPNITKKVFGSRVDRNAHKRQGKLASDHTVKKVKVNDGNVNKAVKDQHQKILIKAKNTARQVERKKILTRSKTAAYQGMAAESTLPGSLEGDLLTAEDAEKRKPGRPPKPKQINTPERTTRATITRNSPAGRVTPIKATPSRALENKGPLTRSPSVQVTPTRGTSSQGMPTRGTPSQGTPTRSVVQGTPTRSTATQGTPARGIPILDVLPKATEGKVTPSRSTPRSEIKRGHSTSKPSPRPDRSPETRSQRAKAEAEQLAMARRQALEEARAAANSQEAAMSYAPATSAFIEDNTDSLARSTRRTVREECLPVDLTVQRDPHLTTVPQGLESKRTLPLLDMTKTIAQSVKPKVAKPKPTSPDRHSQSSDTSAKDSLKSRKSISSTTRKSASPTHRASPMRRASRDSMGSPEPIGRRATRQSTDSTSSLRDELATTTPMPKVALRTPFPEPGDPGTLVTAPTYHPSAEQFQDPISYIASIRCDAEPFGMCRIIPPDGWKPECRLQDDVKFATQTQYIHRLQNRWGCNAMQLACIRKHLEGQGIKLEQPPIVGGVELDLALLLQTIQKFGGINVIECKSKWAKVAEALHLPKTSQERGNRLYDMYCKYLLSYDTLSEEEQTKLEEQVIAEKHHQRAQECVVKGRLRTLGDFYRLSRNLLNMWFKDDPSPKQTETEYWKIVEGGKHHVSVQVAHVDGRVCGSGFPTKKETASSAGPYARHGWNFNIMQHNSGSILRQLGAVSGVSSSTLHIGMLFSTACWSCDQHLLPYVVYNHTGADVIWYCIPTSEEEKFHQVAEDVTSDLIDEDPLWLPDDTLIISPETLRDHGVSLCRIVQKPGQFLVVFPQTFTASICSGYNISESLHFATADWIPLGCKAAQMLHASCKPELFSMERLLVKLARSDKTPLEVLRITLPHLQQIIDDELRLRKQLFELGLKAMEKMQTLDDSTPTKSKRLSDVVKEEENQCEISGKICYLSMVVNEGKDMVYSLEHALPHLQKKKNLKSCKLIYRYDEGELAAIIQHMKNRLAGTGGHSKKKSSKHRNTHEPS